jgi:diguanylate cyclase (GGDEF)-like protein
MTASPWEPALSELRGEFVRGALQRLLRMREQLRSLEASPGDASLRHQLRLQFHGLAGAGSSYGFPAVTRLGLRGERLLDGRDAEGAASDALMPALAGLLDELKGALSVGAAPAAGGTAEPPPLPAAERQPKSVLVVEDEPSWRERLRARLEQEGYVVEDAASCGEALAAAERRLPDAVLCDVVLPDGNGYSLVAALRRLPGAGELPILMASVRTDFLDKVEALTSGADGYYEKPLDWQALLGRLQHLLERRELPPGRILCVEDFAEHAAYLRTVLDSAGYEVETLADPRGFEAALSAFRPDLVLMDILLPSVSGYELTRFLRQHARFASVPVLFLTTEAASQARIRGLEAGGDDHLVKPVAPGLLLTAVASHIERARATRNLLERDGLTRLLSHSAFHQRAREAWERAQRQPERRPSLVMMDLDAFKSVNDRFGHAVGDRVLVAFAALLRRQLRHADVVGRYGGQEFSLLLEGLREPDVARLADRLRAEFGATEHDAPDGTRFRVTLSAGIATLASPRTSVEDWKRAADDALYAAKAQGRDRVALAAAGALTEG